MRNAKVSVDDLILIKEILAVTFILYTEFALSTSININFLDNGKNINILT